ncbi:MAG: beta-galactosidase GalB [Opitutaceae bacterium]|nr:beta-galactosidase GalB [Opitutaceae bacterium]
MEAGNNGRPEGVAVQRSRVCFDSKWEFILGEPKGFEAEFDMNLLRGWLAPTGRSLLNFPRNEASPSGSEPGSTHPYRAASLDTSAWRKLDLPHDWASEQDFNPELAGETGRLPWLGVGWYRKSFNPGVINATERVHLEIDGAMSCALVWCNGRFVGGWAYGYASWSVELTEFLKSDAENVVAIRLMNLPNSARWYPGAGIYRHVWLTRHGAVHVERWGVHVKTVGIHDSHASLQIETEVRNATGDREQMAVTNKLYEPIKKGLPVVVETRIHAASKEGHPLGATLASATSAPALVHDGYIRHYTQTIRLDSPRLWDLKDRSRYVAVTEITLHGRVVDRVETPFGIRRAEFTPTEGFKLNGRRVPLQGVCMHHDLGPLGAALNENALQRQVRILQEMGCNAIRTSHNPPAPELLELCDTMGMLVIDEAFDCWMAPKNPNDYHRYFADWHEKDLRAMVRRDRNRPCVILWSIGNEIAELWKPEGYKLAKRLSSLVKEDDDTRPTTAGYNDTSAGFNGFQNAVDVVGFNYRPTLYGAFQELNPLKPVYGSETSSCVSSRGEYFFPVSDDKSTGRKDWHVSSYDLSAPEWAFAPDIEFEGLDQAPSAAGEFVWTGFDYLGEPTPYNIDPTNALNFPDPVERERKRRELEQINGVAIPSRSSYFGIVDLCGFPKDRFFLYQSRWRPDFPMAHILPHWNWQGREGEVTPVHVYSNGDEAELFINEVSQGRKRRQKGAHRFRWDEVRFQPGVVRVAVYKYGAAWASAQRRTTGEFLRLGLKSEKDSLTSDGRDLAFITVSALDGLGDIVPNAKAGLDYQVEGPIEIVAVDNGDPTSHLPLKGSRSRLFNGLALVILRATVGGQGTARLVATAEGRPPTALQISIEKT